MKFIKKEYIILVIIIFALSLYLVIHKRNRIAYQLPEIPKTYKNEITKINNRVSPTPILSCLVKNFIFRLVLLIGDKQLTQQISPDKWNY